MHFIDKYTCKGRLLTIVAVIAAMAGIQPVPFVQASATDYSLTKMTTITNQGGRVEWSHDGMWIYYDRRQPDGFWDVYRMRPDGSATQCLTCDHPQLENLHQGQPAEHPDGRYLVFQAENQDHPLSSVYHAPAHPGAGVWSNLWVLDMANCEYGPCAAYKINNYTEIGPLRIGGSLHPHFSHDGTKLAWSDFQGAGAALGAHRLAVADFLPDPPRLENIVYYEVGETDRNFTELAGWAWDDSGLYFACNCLMDQDEVNMDVSFLSLASGEWTRLTHSSGLDGEPGQWEEFGHVNPAFGDAVLYISSEPYGTIEENSTFWDIVQFLQTEYWLMNPDGSNPRQLTHFNDPEHEHYIPGGVIAMDVAWSPDGLKAVGLVSTKGQEPTGRLIIFEFTRTDSPTGTLVGLVRDSVSSKRLSGALVQTDTGQSTDSNWWGGYRLTNIPSGIRVITVTKAGYVPLSRSVTVQADRTKAFNLDLISQ